MERAFTVLLVLVVVTGLCSGIAVAGESRSGETVVVGEGETVEGEVTGDAEAFAGNVRIAGDVGGEVSTAAGNVVVGEGARVGALSAAGGSVTIDGTVAGDAEAAVGSVSLGPAAVVEGDLTYGGELTRHPDARVAGTVSQGPTATPAPVGEIPAILWWVGRLYWLGVNLLLGATLLAVAPAFSEGVAATAREEALESGGGGLLALVGTPIALVLLAITVVGIPLSIAGAFVFALVLWIASVYGGFAVGRWLLSLAGYDSRWAALVVGLGAFVLAVHGWYTDREARRAERAA